MCLRAAFGSWWRGRDAEEGEDARSSPTDRPLIDSPSAHQQQITVIQTPFPSQISPDTSAIIFTCFSVRDLPSRSPENRPFPPIFFILLSVAFSPFFFFFFFFCRLGWYSLLDRFNEQPLKASLGGFSPWKRWTASDWYSVPLCCCEGGWYNGRREARCCRRICSSSPSVTTWREQMWGFFLIFFVFLRNILS